MIFIEHPSGFRLKRVDQPPVLLEAININPIPGFSKVNPVRV